MEFVFGRSSTLLSIGSQHILVVGSPSPLMYINKNEQFLGLPASNELLLNEEAVFTGQDGSW